MEELLHRKQSSSIEALRFGNRLGKEPYHRKRSPSPSQGRL